MIRLIKAVGDRTMTASMDEGEEIWEEQLGQDEERDPEEETSAERESAESMKMEIERLRAEKEALERERQQSLTDENRRLREEREEYQRNMLEMQQFMMNNMEPTVPRSRRQRGTLQGYSKATETDSEVFLRGKGEDLGARSECEGNLSQHKPPMATLSKRTVEKKSRNRRPKLNKDDSAADTESTESGEEENAEVGRSRGPWPLRRERRLTKGEKFPQRGKHKDMVPESFTGEADWSEYISQFEVCAEWNKWTEKQKMQQLYVSLRGKARNVIRHDGEEKTITYKELVKRLEQRFSPDGQKNLYLAMLRNRQQKPKETLQEYTEAIRKLVHRAYKELPEEARDRIASDHFMGNLKDREIRTRVRLSHPATLDEALQNALEVTAVFQIETDDRIASPGKCVRHVHKADESGDTQELGDLKGLATTLQEILTELKEQKKETTGEKITKKWNGATRKGQGSHGRQDGRNNSRCFRCGSFDHFVAACPEKDTRPGNDSRPNRGAGEGSVEGETAPKQD